MYWRPDVGSSQQFGPLTISNVAWAVEESNPNIHVRDLRLTLENNEYVRHVHTCEPNFLSSNVYFIIMLWVQ